MVLVTDITGACNLTCPSCPRGRKEAGGPTGLMKFDDWKYFVEKARREFTIDVLDFNNWGEPTLNRDLPEMVAYCVKHGIPARVSTNGQRLTGLDAMIDAGWRQTQWTPIIWVSCSGWSQETYGQTHEGSFEWLRANMIRLAEMRDNAVKPTRTRLILRWHRYRHNSHEEKAARAFARKYGYDFEPQLAWYLPIQNLIAHPSDPVAKLLLVPIEAGLKVSKALPKRPRCPEMDTLQIDTNGQVKLCCLVYNKNVASFAETDLAEIQRRRESHEFCGTCTSHGAYDYLVKTSPRLILIAAKNSSSWDVKLRLYRDAVIFGLGRLVKRCLPLSYKRCSDLSMWIKKLG